MCTSFGGVGSEFIEAAERQILGTEFMEFYFLRSASIPAFAPVWGDIHTVVSK